MTAIRWLALLLLPLGLLASCSCMRDADDAPAVEMTDTTPAPTATPDADASITPEAADAIAALEKRRNDAMYDAVGIVHAYLNALGSGKRTEAETHWAYRRMPTVDEEGGLRGLAGLRALRIENGTPKPLNAERVPDYLEIPVTLRANFLDGTAQRYTGWYRLRRNPVSKTWELTAASVRPQLK